MSAVVPANAAADRRSLRRIAEPGRIGPLKLKNRLIMGPMGTNFGTTDGFSTVRDRQYYAERAKGGVAMIVTEAMNIGAGARNHNNSLCVFDDRFIPGLASVVEGINSNGALAIGQLNHRGQLLRRSVLGMEPVGPSAGVHPFTGEPVRALTIDEIRVIQGDFVAAARRLWQAGYDGVEIHAANGYLFQQFFTQRFNTRTDNYGGSLQNRMRLLLETLRMIKDETPDFPLLVRISASEFVPGGYTQEEAIELAKALEAEGVAALDLSGGSNEHPSLSRYCIQPPSFPRSCLAPHAKPFKDALNIPVIIAGRIVEPEDAEQTLASDSADYISLGRALLADPHWCSKALKQVSAPIRRCISCNVCFERLTLEKDVACVANPMLGTEFEALEYLEPQLFPEMNAKGPLRILVLGAGVAGCEAARTARAIGHEVEIWEQRDHASGQLPLALSAPDKEDVEGVWTYRVQSMNAMGITVQTGKVATADSIRAYAPDKVIVATGAKPREFPMSIDFGVPTHQAWDLLINPDLIAHDTRVTVVGGGLVGIEAADLMVSRGCDVTIIEPRDIIAPEMARNNRFEIMERLTAAGATIHKGSVITRCDAGRIMLRQGPEEIAIPAGNTVVIAVGSQPNRDVLPLLSDIGVPYVLVGDCNQTGDFMTAIRDASMVALSLERTTRPAPAKHSETYKMASINNV